mgnify:CR=1 FL=1
MGETPKTLTGRCLCGDVRFEADVATVNAGAGTLTLAGLPGLTVQVTSLTELKGLSGLAALAADFRPRIALALAVAVLLGVARRAGALERWPDLRPVAFLARISYAVFLVHFPVYLLVSAAFEHFGSESSGAAALALAIGWCASIAAGLAFHRGVELRAAGGMPQRLRTTMPTSAAMPVCCVPSRSSAS